MVADNDTGEKPKGGRPRTRFSRAMLDAALGLLGSEYLTSRIVARLREKYPKLGRNKATDLVNAARGELRAQLAGAGVPPAAILWGAYLKLIFSEEVRDAVKVQALNGAAKLLGAGALSEALADNDEAEALIAAIVARRAARNGTANPNEARA